MLKPWTKLAGRVLQSNFEGLALPFKILLVVTKECHSRCQNCKIWQVKPQNELTLAEIESFAKNSPFLQWLNLTGGETTDRPDLPEIIEVFLRHCPDLIFVNFATNGLKPDHIEKVCGRIKSMGPRRMVVTVSIDGPPKVNDALRGVKGDFVQATETYKRLRKLGIEVYAGMTLYPQNYALVDEAVKAINDAVGDFSYRNLHINVAHTSQHYFENNKRPPPESETKAQAIAAVDAYMRERGIPLKPFEFVERRYLKNIRPYLLSGKTPVPCAAVQSSLYISEHGMVYPCSIWDKPLGNLRESGYSLLPILQSELARQTRTEVRESNCPNCWTPCEAYQSLGADFI